MLKDESLETVLPGVSKEFAKIKVEELTDNFAKICGGSVEDSLSSAEATAAGAAPGEASGAIPPAGMGKQEALKRFTVDLTEKARKGEIDPIVGRDEEIRQVVDILMRRRRTNPILTGEAGVGKTAVVEGFALRIARGDVPPMLKDVALRTLDLGLLQAGASMKGEFEERLRSVIEEVQASPKPIIPVHRRGAPAHRRRRGRRPERCRQPPQARPRPRHPQDHRRHHPPPSTASTSRRTPPSPALPGHQGRRAQRGQGPPHAPRHGLHPREAPQGSAPR